jgi:flagellar motor switch protein FliN/FliY
MSTETEVTEQEAQAETADAATAAGFPDIQPSDNLDQVDEDKCLDLMRDVSLKVKVELGRGKMLLQDVIRLTKGSVVELEKLAGDPLDIFVNNRLIARGEVLVLNDNFCIRITEILSPEEVIRIKQG